MLTEFVFFFNFSTGNTLYSGDHVSWHLPLDQTPSASGQFNCNPSHIQHMLMVDDPRLPVVTSPLGSVRFIQVLMNGLNTMLFIFKPFKSIDLTKI